MRADRTEVAPLWARLEERAGEAGGELAFRFLGFDGEPSGELDWARLRARSVGFARELLTVAAPGDRVLLVYDSGLEFLVGFFGCLYAGMVAIPAPPPRRPFARSLHRLVAIARDSGARVGTASAGVRAELQEHLPRFPDLAELSWHDPADASADLGGLHGLRPTGAEDLAYLQYTSGSTAQPKGVAVAQSHVAANCVAMDRAWRHDADSVMVTWLPVFHDMGLVYSTFLPVLFGFPTLMMRPTAFVRRPARWLEAVRDHRGTHSIAPNFGFDLCVRKIADAERAGLDLSSWRVAANASEPVRAASMRRFAEEFAGCGFRAAALAPAYGLAEATLLVTAAPLGTGAVVREFDPDALAIGRGEPAAGEGIALASSGRVLDTFDVRVVDPRRGSECGEGELGEIWLRGPSVADGYLGHPEATEQAFAGRLDDRDPFLRSGDLGFLRDGELYVRGRVKDVMVFAGQNHHPQDIEATVFEAHPALRPGCAAAFSVDHGDAERLVVIVEAADDALPTTTATEAITAVRRAVAEGHQLTVDGVVLLRRGTVHKTSSGKIQRSLARRDYLHEELAVVAAWQSPRLAGSGRAAVDGPAPDRAGLRAWLRAQAADLTGVPVADIRTDEPLATYGLGSIGAAELAAGLQRLVDRPVPDDVLFHFPTIDRLAAEFTAAGGAGRAVPAPAVRPPVPSGPVAPARPEPVAVVGIGCRFPGAGGPRQLWELLWGQGCGIREVPAERRGGRDEPALRRAGLLDDPGAFDAGFFRISPREARTMDPQQRMLLEVAWEAVEDAGTDPLSLAGRPVGVFVGLWSPDFAMRDGDHMGTADPYLTTGYAHSIAANRISYALDTVGPSMTVDTACSSSLVAVHLAVASLRSGESEIALAGGANLLLLPEVTAAFANGGLLSPTGRCSSFGAAADGYVRAEGAGVVVLKTLSRARADGDEVYALIRSTAVRHEGRTNGLTAPSQPAQEELLRTALRQAGVRGADVDFVEAHGSGTPVGDRIEAHALGAVVGHDRAGDDPCAIGSVKSSLGHLEAAAGVAGLIKACLALREGALPASLGCAEPNPTIDFAAIGLSPQARCATLPERPRPLLAGVSSFGFGGAIAHAVLEQYRERSPVRHRPGHAPARAALLPVTAEDPQSLSTMATAYAAALADSALDPHAFCHAAAVRRSGLSLRAGVVGRTRAELVERLGELAGAAHRRATEAPDCLGPVFVYSGQGGSWSGMGAALFGQEPVFREAVERCDAIVRNLAGWSLVDALHDTDTDALAHTDIAQPTQIAVQLALTDLLAHWGVRPAAVTGHSVGEIAAGYGAGALDVRRAMTLAVHRGQVLTAAQDRGGMLAVRMPEAGLRDILAEVDGRIAIAARNAPGQHVLSGPVDELAVVEERLRARDVRHRRLTVNYPGHAPSLAPLAAEMSARAASVASDEPGVPWWSTVHGRLLSAGEVTADHWGALVHRPVRFAEVVAGLAERGHRTFVEVGSRPMLTGAILESAGVAADQLLVLPTMAPEAPDRAGLLELPARLFEAGHPLDWAGLTGADGRGVTLPGYPWHHEMAADPTARGPVTPARDSAGPARGGELLRLRWEPGTPPRTPRGPSRWLLFADRGGVAKRAARLWRSRGAECHLVPAPPADVRTDPDRMWAAVREHCAGIGPDTGVVYLWALDLGPAAGPAEIAGLAAHGPAALAGALSGDSTPAATFGVVTAGAAPGRPGSGVPAASPAWGVLRAFHLEHPDRRCALIDLDPDQDTGAQADELARVVGAGAAGEWARHGGAWHRPRLDALEPVPTVPRVRAGGCYLVTGGLGLVGTHVVRWLSRAGARRVVVTGRRATAAGLDPLRAELAGRGTSVEYRSADVADAGAVTGLVSGLSGLCGVVHAAGVLEDASLRTLDAGLLDRVLAPKLHGGHNILTATKHLDLDFLLLLSSAVGTLGSPGQAAYCAANAFLDATAASAAGPVTAIGFGPWSGGGLAEDARLRSGRTLPGLPALDPADGIELVPGALGTGAPVVLAARVDIGELVGAWPGVAPLFGRDGRSGTPADPAHSAGEGPAVRTGAELAAILREELGRELGLDGDSIDPDVPFRRLGLDSLGSTALNRRLKQRLRTPLSATLDLNYPTLRKLTAHLVELLGLAAAAEPVATAAQEPAVQRVEQPAEEAVVDELLEELENLAPGDLADLITTLTGPATANQED